MMSGSVLVAYGTKHGVGHFAGRAVLRPVGDENRSGHRVPPWPSFLAGAAGPPPSSRELTAGGLRVPTDAGAGGRGES